MTKLLTSHRILHHMKSSMPRYKTEVVGELLPRTAEQAESVLPPQFVLTQNVFERSFERRDLFLNDFFLRSAFQFIFEVIQGHSISDHVVKNAYVAIAGRHEILSGRIEMDPGDGLGVNVVQATDFIAGFGRMKSDRLVVTDRHDRPVRRQRDLGPDFIGLESVPSGKDDLRILSLVELDVRVEDLPSPVLGNGGHSTRIGVEVKVENAGRVAG